MSIKKGIILAGGNGSRLMPLTKSISKQLLPVYDKPMIYYPLATLMSLGIRDILIISTRRDLPRFKELLNNGSNIGLSISYEFQNKPNGIAEAFIIGKNFIGSDSVCLILGDNIFHGKNIDKLLAKAIKNLDNKFSSIVSVNSNNPKDFGVIEFNSSKKIQRIIEKPKKTKSKSIVSGIYFFTNDVIKVASALKPSQRGELEIIDVVNYFLEKDKLKVINLNNNFFWSDTGTYDSLIETSNYFNDIEKNTHKKVACVEEIALLKKFISLKEFAKIKDSMSSSNYGKYLSNIINENINWNILEQNSLAYMLLIIK